MDKHCDHNIPETKKGAGPCVIRWEVRKRNSQPNWWCRTHGLEASAPDGTALPECTGAWFDPVVEEMQLEVDAATAEIAVWGVIRPAIEIGKVEQSPGKVHVHRRPSPGADKDIDRSFDIVRVRNGDVIVTVEGMAAQAYAVSQLTGIPVVPLTCPRCGEVHIDELMFATNQHIKHLCNACGRNFRDKQPSVSNPLGATQERLGLLPAPGPRHINRPLTIDSSDYASVAMWPSNAAIISTMTRPEDQGVHVHAWSTDGRLVIDETHSPVTLDGQAIDERALRLLSVQRELARGAPILRMVCKECNHLMLSPATGWVQAVTRHVCDVCGTENRTPRKAFLNPLASEMA
jgi:transcription elongation factor Elf1